LLESIDILELSPSLFVITDTRLILGVFNPLLKIPQPWAYLFEVRFDSLGIFRKFSLFSKEFFCSTSFCYFLEQLLVDTLRLVKLSLSDSYSSDGPLFFRRRSLLLPNRYLNGELLVWMLIFSLSTVSYWTFTLLTWCLSKMVFSSLVFSFLEEAPLLNSLFKVSFIRFIVIWIME